jgi:hypothetical protein
MVLRALLVTAGIFMALVVVGVVFFTNPSLTALIIIFGGAAIAFIAPILLVFLVVLWFMGGF